MSLPAQFQIGLELTNIVNPLAQAVSAVGSLALVDAIKKAGSDAITEVKLASLIGRHRIDEVIQWHFRQQVEKPHKSIFSRYVDIVLEAGAGPTVQEALKHPALLSMVIQLSALAFGTEDESLANGIVEALERIVRESGREVDIVPDYVSLLGTIRACQQQTAAFQWAPSFEDVERKIEKAFTSNGTQESEDASHRAKRRRTDHGPPKKRSSITIRALPFPILQSLIMWLQTLQNFPDHRLLHLKCDRGISMVVIWCHHLLGLTVSVKSQDAEVTFGKGTASIVVEESGSQSAILMDPVDPNEPLFSLAKEENYPGGSHELRTDAYGFGRKVLEDDLGDTNYVHYCSHWVIGHCLAMVDPEKQTRSRFPVFHDVLSPVWQRHRLLRAARFVFAQDNIDMALVSSICNSPLDPDISSRVSELHLMAILIAFARVEADDLDRIRYLPLSLKEYQRIRKSQHGIDRLRSPKHDASMGKGRFDFPTTVLEAFSILSRLLLGHMYSEEYVDAVLVSAWGWSISFDCMDTTDPADVSIDKLRVLHGVPTRHGLRRMRIIDGPVGTRETPSAVEVRVGGRQFRHFPGVSSARKGRVLVGYHSDAFQVTQPLLWEPVGKEVHTHRLAFRDRLIQCVENTFVLKPCNCAERDIPYDTLAWLDERLKRSRPDGQSYISKWPGASDSESESEMPERALEISNETKNTFGLWFYVGDDNPSARWFLLDDLRKTCGKRLLILIRSRDTCVRCATDSSMFEGIDGTSVVIL